LEGFVIARLYFVYIQLKDLEESVQIYLDQRPSEKVQLIGIDPHSLSFFSENLKIEEESIIILPTKINVIQ